MSDWNQHPMSSVIGSLSPIQQRVSYVGENYYIKLDAQSQGFVDKVVRTLEEEYPGKGKVARTACPFHNQEELDRFSNTVAQLTLSLAFQVASQIHQDRASW